jgi:hypothetical protein
MPSRSNIRPIPTAYGGYQFRSRIEARWAVFFTQMQFRWRYEDDGWPLPGGWYLPDFLLLLSGERGLWVEIKPHGVPESDAVAKCAELASGHGWPVYLVCGAPQVEEFRWYRFAPDGKRIKSRGDATHIPAEWYFADRAKLGFYPDEREMMDRATRYRFELPDGGLALEQPFRMAAS